MLLIGGLEKYRAIEAKAVGGAMAKIAQQSIKGVHRYELDKIQDFSNQYNS